MSISSRHVHIKSKNRLNWSPCRQSQQRDKWLNGHGLLSICRGGPFRVDLVHIGGLMSGTKTRVCLHCKRECDCSIGRHANVSLNLACRGNNSSVDMVA